MKLTTLNLQGFTGWQQQEPRIVAYLQQEDPDLIFFQEVVYVPEVSAYNQVQLLNTTMSYLFEHSSTTRLQVGLEYTTYREGLSVLSKTPVVKTDTIILKKAPNDEHNRIVQLIDVFIGGQVVKFANVHFSITDVTDFATAHLVETLSILRARGEQRIIAGDFNLSNLDDSRHIWESEYLSSESTTYISFPSENKRIDYVLIPKHYSFTSIRTSDTPLSDHRAVTVAIS